MNLALYKPEKAVLALKDYNTPAKCMNSDTPTLAEIRKENGEDKVLTAIEAWIVDMGEFLNISRPMNPRQIRQTAVLVLSEFYYFKVADINLLFTRAKKGQYGELYGSLDGTKIYQWFEQYDIERAETAYNDALRQHDKIKAQEKR
jgi:hypothetical protein